MKRFVLLAGVLALVGLSTHVLRGQCPPGCEPPLNGITVNRALTVSVMADSASVQPTSNDHLALQWGSEQWIPVAQDLGWTWLDDNAVNADVTIYIVPNSTLSGTYGNNWGALFAPSDWEGGAQIYFNDVYLENGDWNNIFYMLDQWNMLASIAAHEFGHDKGFDHASYGCDSLMRPTMSFDNIRTVASDCDNAALAAKYPALAPDCSGCATPGPCQEAGWYIWECDCCTEFSPILLPLRRGPLRLSSSADGVWFDIAGTGDPMHVAWPVDGSGGWLALDRNANGLIDDGTELFGSVTPIAGSTQRAPNGFEALRRYDFDQNGQIDARDPIFRALRVWVDANSDGKTQPGELVRLSDAGVVAVSLEYRLIGRRDQWGNTFRYQAFMTAAESPRNRLCYDVIVTVTPVDRDAQAATATARSATSRVGGGRRLGAVPPSCVAGRRPK